MPVTFIPFDGWSPSGSYFGDGWSTVTSLYPAFGDNRPWPKFVQTPTFSVADSRMTGSHVHIYPSGVSTTTYVPDSATGFCGSPTKLYSIDLPAGAGFNNRSRAAPYTANPAGWRFATVGNDIWATNWLDALQRRTNNTGNFADGVVSTFKPRPRYLATVREHLVGANLSNAGRFADEVAWSDADDATNFDAATGTSTSLAGSKRLTSISGQITGIVGGQYMLAFKRQCIYYGEYQGPPQLFGFDLLSESVGTALPSSIIKTRYGLFFFGPDGFYKIDGLSPPQKISPPGIDKYVLDSTFSNYPYTAAALLTGTFLPSDEDTQMVAFQIPGMPIIGWAFRLAWASYGNEQAVLYNPVADQWALVSIADTDGVFPFRPTSLFSLPFSTSVNACLVALTTNGTECQYSPLSNGGTVFGPTLGMNFRPANFDDTSIPVTGQSQIKGVLPMFSKTSVSGASLSPSITIEALLDPYSSTWGTPTVLAAANRDNFGWYPAFVAGRLFRITVNCVAEDFANFEGVFVNQEPLR